MTKRRPKVKLFRHDARRALFGAEVRHALGEPPLWTFRSWRPAAPGFPGVPVGSSARRRRLCRLWLLARVRADLERARS